MITYMVQLSLQLSTFQEVTQSSKNVRVGDDGWWWRWKGAGLSTHGARVACFLLFFLAIVMDVVSAAAEVHVIPVAAFLVA